MAAEEPMEGSAQGSTSSRYRRGIPMAGDVGKSLSDGSLSGKAEGDGSWDRAELQTGCPELADSLRQLWGAEGAKPGLQGMEGKASSRHSRLAAGATQGGLNYHQEVSSASASGFPRARASRSGAETLPEGAAGGSDVPRRAGHRFLGAEEQQVKASGCWEPASSPASRRSSAEESVLGSQRSQSLGARSPCSSTPELLRPQTPPSPEIPLRSRSASCFSALSLEGNGLSEEPSQSLLASTDTPPAAAAASRERCRGWAAAEGGLLWAREPLSPLHGDRAAVERLREMSSYQANYWACAIPDSLPPSPDRRSPHWNPNKEYEDLLDYAYPLKPRYKLGKMPEPFFHDSGIGLDSCSASPEGTSRSTSVYGRGGQARGSGDDGLRSLVACAERFSTLRSGKRGCSGAGSYYEPLPITEEFSFPKSPSSQPSRGFATDVTLESSGPGSSGCAAAGGRSWCARGSPLPNSNGQVKSTHRFLPTTRVLPLRKEWEGDEEFLSLPPRLRELERLAQFVSNLSLTMRTPGHNRQSLLHPSDSEEPPLPELAPFAEAGGRDARGNTEGYAGLRPPRSSAKPSWKNTELRGQIRRDPLRGLHLPAGLGDSLGGTYLNELRVRGQPKKRQQSESLAQCVKVFCSQLEELICWLYSITDVTDDWVPAAPDAESLTASLRRCSEFRKEVANHRSLTESVLERGEALLDCMASNTPALRETLSLIVKQSEALETHAEQWHESVLAAVAPRQEEDEGLQQQAAPWVLPLSSRLC